MESRLLHFVPVILTLVTLINLASADPPVTPKDRAALRRFRPEVDHFLPHDYMKEDSYLLRWIRQKKYDLDGAKELLQKNIQWRRDNDVDNWEYDPKSVFAKDFPIVLSGVDNEGRPVVISDWSGDIRKYVVAGKRKELVKYIAGNYEFGDRKARELNVHKNNSQWTFIPDFNKFAARTHLCVQCLPVYLDLAVIKELYYPLALKEAVVINAPRIFQTLLRLVAPVLGDTMKRITTLGVNKSEWKRYILERIPADQLPIKYGGTQQLYFPSISSREFRL